LGDHDVPYISIRFAQAVRSVSLTLRDEPEDFLDWISGDIIASDQNELEYRIGGVSAVLVELSRAMNSGVDAAIVADSHQLVMSHIGGLLERMEEGEAPFEEGAGDILLVDSVALHPVARGFGLGPLVLARTMDHFDRYGLATVIRPWPLQFDKETRTDGDGRRIVAVSPRSEHIGIPMDGLPHDVESSLRKLTALWEGVGFREVPISGGESVWVFPPHRRHALDLEAIEKRLAALDTERLRTLEPWTQE